MAGSWIRGAGDPLMAAILWCLDRDRFFFILFVFAVLSTMTLGFGGDQPRILMTLPISPAARFRALYSLMFFEGIGNWLMLAVVVIGIPLIIVMGWQAFIWLLLLLLGVTIAVWMSIVVLLIVLRYVMPYLKKAFLSLVVMCVVIGIVYMGLHLVGISLRLSALSTPVPLFVSLLCLIMLVIVAGPFAGFTGKLYEEAFHEMEGRTRSRTVINIPGVRLLNKLLRRNRNLTVALMVKGLLNQSRNVFTWGRVAIILVSIAIFPMLQTFLISLGFSKVLLAVVYASGVAILAIVDYAPYAASSEGSRLVYYLVARVSIKTYLRSRLMVLLIGMMFLLVWKLPMFLSVPSLLLLNAIVLISGWHFSKAQIQGLINRG
jgi:hypothetical protein